MSHLMPLLSALDRAGCDVHLLCMGDGGLATEAKRRGLPTVVMPMANKFDPRVVAPLRRFLSDGQWDVVHSHGVRANIPVRVVTRTMRRQPVLVTTVHSDLRLDYSSPQLARIYEAADRRTLGQVDLIICVSKSLRDLLVSRGYPEQKLMAIHSGLEGLQDSSGQHDGKRVSGRRVGCVARLVPVKDMDLLIEAGRILHENHGGAELVVIGDGPERQRLETVARSALPTGTFSFLGSRDDVEDLLHELDVYVVTSLYEGGVSMSVLEAMESGLPVVTTSAGGVEEAVVDGETGFVVSRSLEKHALATSLAERIAALLDNPTLAAEMGGAGARRVRAEFGIERTAAKILGAYERCLAVRTGGS